MRRSTISTMLASLVLCSAGCTEYDNYYYATLESPNTEVIKWDQPRPYEHVISLRGFKEMPVSFETVSEQFIIRAENPLDDHVSMLELTATDQNGNSLGLEGRVLNPCIGQFRTIRKLADNDGLYAGLSFELSQSYTSECNPGPVDPGLEIAVELLVYRPNGQYIGMESASVRVATNGHMKIGAGL